MINLESDNATISTQFGLAEIQRSTWTWCQQDQQENYGSLIQSPRKHEQDPKRFADAKISRAKTLSKSRQVLRGARTYSIRSNSELRNIQTTNHALAYVSAAAGSHAEG